MRVCTSLLGLRVSHTQSVRMKVVKIVACSRIWRADLGLQNEFSSRNEPLMLGIPYISAVDPTMKFESSLDIVRLSGS